MLPLSRDEKKDLYRFMRLNRTVEERLVNLYRQGKVLGGLYRSLGQEATSVGSAYALEEGDMLGPLIRNLGSVLVHGCPARDIFSQYLARGGSPSGGKDCNLHFGSIERGIIPPISMLGELIPVMAGVALAAKLQRKRIVCLTYIGDGATSTGAFHEGMNFASVQRVPLIVVGENNRWAYSTPLSQQMNCSSLADRAKAYGVPAVTVDGNDVEAVYRATREGVDRARDGGGVTFIEAQTYRIKGHAEHDAQEYVDRVELEAWERRDPLDRFVESLVSREEVTRPEIEQIDAEVAAYCDVELAAAEQSPFPPAAAALEGVYASGGAPHEPAIIRFAEER
jgi:pyruvate dehydrogenase E1 component alpha subunit/2-oxoisovalerate dehydrogenase E1 component alpha subunit